MPETDLTPCDCSHARNLHDEGLYACEVANCECLAFVALENVGGVDLTETEDIDEEDDLLEPYEQDPDWWKP